MPEGDTIRRLANAIEHKFLGQRITHSVFRHPSLALARLDNSTLDSADARGKHLLVRISDGRTLHAHMLMQGRVRFGRAHEVPEWRRRFEIEFETGVITGIDVPKIEMIKTRNERRVVAHLGPDLCGHYDHDRAVERLSTAGSGPLGGSLLDQRLIAGFGNIYAVETPFICGISPFQPVESITDLARVVAVGAALIRTNASLGPQRTTGQSRVRADHWILPNERRRCLVCGARVTRYTGRQSPWQRRLGVCPQCQPRASEATVERERVRALLANHPARKILDLDNGRLSVSTDNNVESISLR
ncbi:MAG: DNA-formamidopyrimidine glycosylase family protein [Acidimicrobiales bacterium]